MRTDAAVFAQANLADSKEPRFVVNIVYDVSSIYITSQTGISGVPGTVIDGALKDPSITSQTINPDDASAEIGSASFSLVDLGSAFTSAVRTQLGTNGQGIRNRTVRFYLGYAGLAFSDFVLLGTQMVTDVTYSKAAYQISCNDIQRSLKKDIFDVIQTTLSASIGATDTTIGLTSVTGLTMVAHGTSYSDAPSTTVGYIKIKDEVIRYTGISSLNLTGCTRGALGTVAAAYTVDPATPSDRREKVTEYVYLELPAIDLAYRVLTGKNSAGTVVMPANWHLGIDTALVDLAAFTGILNDLWDTTDPTAGFRLRFEGLTKTDGKQFVEKEIYFPSGVYSPVLATGKLSLRRMTRIIQGGAPVATLNETNSISAGAIQNDLRSLHNFFRINWSYNGKEFRRHTDFIDATSASKHGTALIFERSFKGLYGGLHTDGVIFQILDRVRDRYAGPPLRRTVELLPSMNTLEVGDPVAVQYATDRDFTTSASGRTYEVQNVSYNQRTGRVSADLFASSSDPSVTSPTATVSVSLPNAFYNSAGSTLASVIGGALSGNTIVSNCSIPGNASLTAAGAIVYHLNNLTINAGVTVTIGLNVQLRVMGFLTVNGTINGAGAAANGVADTGQTLTLINPTIPAAIQPDSIAGTPGFIGTARGTHGVDIRPGTSQRNLQIVSTRKCSTTTGANAVAPQLNVRVSGSALLGLPSDLRGTGGGPGGRGGQAGATVLSSYWGGAGGAGGAGLAIICRGMAPGIAASIDLSGANGTAPSLASFTPASGKVFTHYPGSGAGGGPGAMYIFLDGGSLSVPDLGTKFRGFTGSVPLQGNALLYPLAVDADSDVPVQLVGGYLTYPAKVPPLPITGYQLGEPPISVMDMSVAAVRIQYIPAPETVTGDVNSGPAPVTALTTIGRVGGVNVFATWEPSPSDVLQIYASTINDRTTSVQEFEGVSSFLGDRFVPSITKYYWARTRRATTSGNLFSTWYPVSPTAGVSGTPTSSKYIARVNCVASDVSFSKVGGSSAWDSDVYSIDGYSTAHVQFKPAQTDHAFMIGLNSDPTTDSDQAGIDCAWFCDAAGNATIRENGVNTSGSVAYRTSDEFSISYNGTTAAFYINRVLIGNAATSGTKFLDSSFYNPGGTANSIIFGPGTQFEDYRSNTMELADEAATEILVLTGIVGNVTSSTATTVDSISYGTLPFDCIALITLSCTVFVNFASGGFPLPAPKFILRCAQAASGPIVSSKICSNLDYSGPAEITFMVPLVTGVSPVFEVQLSGSGTVPIDLSVGTLKVELIKR